MKTEELGEPDLAIGCLALWVHGRQFPDATDYWDSNWLTATAVCETEGASVRAHGNIIHLGEILGLQRGCEELSRTLTGTAVLDCAEPNLRIVLEARPGGHIDSAIDITNDHLHESHQFRAELDQTNLSGLVSACKRIIWKYPVRGSAEADADGTSTEGAGR